MNAITSDPDNILFIDGSYKQTGLTLALPNKEVFLGGVSVKAVTGKGFSNMVSGSFIIVDGIRKWLSKIPYDIKTLTVVIEAPYPSGFSSTTLYGLDFSILHSLREIYSLIAFSIPPSKIYNLTKSKMGGDSKIFRKKYASEIVESAEKKGWIFSNKKILENNYNDDIETSLILWWECLAISVDPGLSRIFTLDKKEYIITDLEIENNETP